MRLGWARVTKIAFLDENKVTRSPFATTHIMTQINMFTFSAWTAAGAGPFCHAQGPHEDLHVGPPTIPAEFHLFFHILISSCRASRSGQAKRLFSNLRGFAQPAPYDSSSLCPKKHQNVSTGKVQRARQASQSIPAPACTTRGR